MHRLHHLATAPLHAVARGVAALALVASVACGTSETLLEVQDPDIINPGDLTTAASANALRLGALSRLAGATSGGESTLLLGGLLADEYRSTDTFLQRNETDRRAIQNNNANTTAAFRTLFRARLSAEQAVGELREFAAPAWQIGQMYMVQAYTVNQLGETFCGAIPISSVSEGREVLGTPLTTQATFERALAYADSGLVETAGTTANDVSIRNALLVLRGRILVNLARYADAAAAVAAVPTTYTFNIEHSANTSQNQIWALNNSIGRWSVSQGEGGNGIDFFGANDPRVPTCRLALNGTTTSRVGCGSDTPVTVPFDNGSPVIAGNRLIIQQKWDERYDPVSIMNGTEARLIQAEALLAGGNAAGALAALNALRAAATGLAPLADAGTPSARVDQLFRERAFWLFGTGRRLGDLRRLIRQYNRPANTVFPTGPWFKGGDYGTDVNIPVPQDEENNENFDRAACVKTQA